MHYARCQRIDAVCARDVFREKRGNRALFPLHGQLEMYARFLVHLCLYADVGVCERGRGGVRRRDGEVRRGEG